MKIKVDALCPQLPRKPVGKRSGNFPLLRFLVLMFKGYETP